MRVVFDTNVLISAALSRTGSPFKCLDLAKQGVIESVTCKEILEEFRQKMIEKFKRSTDQADDLVGDVLGYSQVVSITGELRAVETDPSDDKVVVVPCQHFPFAGASNGFIPPRIAAYPERAEENMDIINLGRSESYAHARTYR